MEIETTYCAVTTRLLATMEFTLAPNLWKRIIDMLVLKFLFIWQLQQGLTYVGGIASYNSGMATLFSAPRLTGHIYNDYVGHLLMYWAFFLSLVCWSLCLFSFSVLDKIQYFLLGHTYAQWPLLGSWWILSSHRHFGLPYHHHLFNYWPVPLMCESGQSKFFHIGCLASTIVTYLLWRRKYLSFCACFLLALLPILTAVFYTLNYRGTIKLYTYQLLVLGICRHLCPPSTMCYFKYMET